MPQALDAARNVCGEPKMIKAAPQNRGCRANLQDHIRNDVEVRSIAGSVVL